MALSASEWASISVLYERGEKNTRELSEQFKVTRQAIEKGLKDRGIQKNSRLDEVRNDTDERAREELARRIAEANKHKTDYANYQNALGRMVMKKVAEAEKVGAVAGVNAEVIVLGNAIKAIAKSREEIWSILDIPSLEHSEEDLPDLNIGEYTEDEIEGIKEANEDAWQAGLAEDHEDDDLQV